MEDVQNVFLQLLKAPLFNKANFVNEAFGAFPKKKPSDDCP